MDWYLYDNGLRHERVKHKSNKKSIPNKKLPLIITYHRSLKTVGEITRKHLYLLKMNKELKKTFIQAPMF